MTNMPIHNPIEKPSSLDNQYNGSVNSSLLEDVDRDKGQLYQLVHEPARGMRALHAAVKAEFGVQLSTTGRGRTYDQQRFAFQDRHVNVTKAVYDATAPIPGTANKRIWPEARSYGYPTVYFLLKKGYASAAVPGTSPHGWWCADDVCLPGSVGIGTRPDILQWMYAHAGQYGFAWSLTSEPWHIQWIMGDVIPQAVLDYEASLNPEPPHPNPQPDPETELMITVVEAFDVVNGQRVYRPDALIGYADKDGNILTVNWCKPNQYNAYAHHVQLQVSDLKNCNFQGPMAPSFNISEFSGQV